MSNQIWCFMFEKRKKFFSGKTILNFFFGPDICQAKSGVSPKIKVAQNVLKHALICKLICIYIFNKNNCPYEICSCESVKL